MRTQLYAMRKKSMFILPALMLVLTMGFATGMDVCTAMGHHHHAHHADHSACSHGEISHICGDSHTVPSRAPACDASNHRHIQISLASDSRLPESTPAPVVQTPHRLAEYASERVFHIPFQQPHACVATLTQNIRPVVLLI